MWSKLLIISCLVPLFVGILFIYIDKDQLFLHLKMFSTHFNNSNHRLITLYTREELQLFNGKQRPELYLAVLGKIFDVTKGANHYGPGKNYNFFIGIKKKTKFIIYIK